MNPRFVLLDKAETYIRCSHWLERKRCQTSGLSNADRGYQSMTTTNDVQMEVW